MSVIGVLTPRTRYDRLAQSVAAVPFTQTIASRAASAAAAAATPSLSFSSSSSSLSLSSAFSSTSDADTLARLLSPSGKTPSRRVGTAGPTLASSASAKALRASSSSSSLLHRATSAAGSRTAIIASNAAGGGRNVPKSAIKSQQHRTLSSSASQPALTLQSSSSSSSLSSSSSTSSLPLPLPPHISFGGVSIPVADENYRATQLAERFASLLGSRKLRRKQNNKTRARRRMELGLGDKGMTREEAILLGHTGGDDDDDSYTDDDDDDDDDDVDSLDGSHTMSSTGGGGGGGGGGRRNMYKRSGLTTGNNILAQIATIVRSVAEEKEAAKANDNAAANIGDGKKKNSAASSLADLDVNDNSPSSTTSFDIFVINIRHNIISFNVMSSSSSSSLQSSSASSIPSTPLTLTPSTIIPPLPLPSRVSRNTFVLSPLSSPDLVLAIIIPGHPLYSNHALPRTRSESHLNSSADKSSSSFGSSISHFLGSFSNTITNTAANTIGVKNVLERNKPKLKLVPRCIDPAVYEQNQNQRWCLSAADGCIYSCVEESGGSYYRLGQRKNAVMRVKSKQANSNSASETTPTDSTMTGRDVSVSSRPNANGGVVVTAATTGAAATAISARPANTRNSSISGMPVIDSGDAALASSDSSPSPSSTASSQSLISVTTSSGNTVLCPLQWEIIDGSPILADTVNAMIAINSVEVVIEDCESISVNRRSTVKSSSIHSLNSTTSMTGSKSANNSTNMLVIKNTCCGLLDCEIEKVDIGSSCGFKSQKDSEVTLTEEEGGGSAASSSSSSSTPKPIDLSYGDGRSLTIKHIWRMESDFSVWLSSLSRSVSTEYHITRKMQRAEASRQLARKAMVSSPTHIPMPMTSEYEYERVWSTDGTKASMPCSIWRPKFPTSASSTVVVQQLYFGDYLQMKSLTPPADRHILAVRSVGAALHPGLVRPVDFKLIWTKNKGKTGYLHVWLPIAPAGVDAMALGHIITVGAKPSINCGVVLVMRGYLKDTGLPLQSAWLDVGIGGGASGSSSSDGGLWTSPSMHTFYCNPSTHTPPSGSCYTLIGSNDSDNPSTSLWRSTLTDNSSWSPIWDDRNTGAPMSSSLSVWRPLIDPHTAFVRFGDMIVRGHEAPSHRSIIALDHPAFQRPASFVLISKIHRGVRKCYIYQPIPCDDDHIALGVVISATKCIDTTILMDTIRCVHKTALVPLGILKQLWMESHSGMLNMLTLGMTNLIRDKDGVVSMLWRNRSLMTVLVVQSSHRRPAGPVYRLAMTETELAETVSSLEVHATFVLESVYVVLESIEASLIKSSYKRLTLSPKQVATIYQVIKGVYKYLNTNDGTTAAFALSSPFRSYLVEFESIRLPLISRRIKRYLFETILADIEDQDTTCELFDDHWSLLKQMGDAQWVFDEVDQWTPKCAKFVTKPLVTLLMEGHIGLEIAARFFAAFPQDIAGMMDGDEDEANDEDEVDEVEIAKRLVMEGKTIVPSKVDAKSTSGDKSSHRSSLSSIVLPPLVVTYTPPPVVVVEAPVVPVVPVLSPTDSIALILSKLDDFRSELDAMIGITSVMQIRRLYLGLYQSYLTLTLHQHYPVVTGKSPSVHFGRTKTKLTMSNILSIVSWICSYVEFVEIDLFEDNRSDANSVLAKMIDMSESLMDAYAEYAKIKMLGWVTSLLKQEEGAQVELREIDGDQHSNPSSYFYTNGPTDLFIKINTIYESTCRSLSGRPLARIALMYVHVITYYQQVMMQYFNTITAIDDKVDHTTVKGKTEYIETPHAGSLIKPTAYVLASINNYGLNQSNVIDLYDRVYSLMDDPSSTDAESLHKGYAQCDVEFATLAKRATDVLIRRVRTLINESMSKLFAKAWLSDDQFFQESILDELDEVNGRFAPNIENILFSTYLLCETTKYMIVGYIQSFVKNAKSILSATTTVAVLSERIEADHQAMIRFCDAMTKWSVLPSMQIWLDKVQTISVFLVADHEFLNLNVAAVIKQFEGDAMLPPWVVLVALLDLRTEVTEVDRKKYLARYEVELKAIRDAEKRAASSAASKFLHIPISKSIVAPSPSAAANGGNNSTVYVLDIILQRGAHLAIKDTNSSDPYCNILIMNEAGQRLEKRTSKVIYKTLDPTYDWNETFTGFKPAITAAMSAIRIEVWDKDFISKDFMGWTQITLDMIQKQSLFDRRNSSSSSSSSGRSSVSDDGKQSLFFKLPLEPLEGKANTGSNSVSGHIEVVVKWTANKVDNGSSSGVTGRVIATPSMSQSNTGRSSVAPLSITTINSGAQTPADDDNNTNNDDDDDEMYQLDHTGHTGSKRAINTSNDGNSRPSSQPSSKPASRKSSRHPSPDRSLNHTETPSTPAATTIAPPQWDTIFGSTHLPSVKSSLPTLASSSSSSSAPTSSFFSSLTHHSSSSHLPHTPPPAASPTLPSSSSSSSAFPSSHHARNPSALRPRLTRLTTHQQQSIEMNANEVATLMSANVASKAQAALAKKAKTNTAIVAQPDAAAAADAQTHLRKKMAKAEVFDIFDQR